MIRKFFAAFTLIFFMTNPTALAAENYPSILVSFEGVTAEFKYGKYGYPNTVQEKDILFAIGEAMGPRNWNKRDNFYKTFARQATRIAALRNLAEAMSGLKVEHFSNFKEGIDKLRTTLIHNSKVFKLLEENARQVGNATFDEEGICTIFMAVRISSHK